MAKQESALVPVESYVIVAAGDKVGELVNQNLGGEGLSPQDLPRVPIPAAGGTTWTIPTVEGEKDVKQLDGVIVYTCMQRVFWKESFEKSGGGSPPDCYSPNGSQGVGDPGGLCASCPFGVFGSADNQRAQACSQRRLIFLLPPDQLLPLVISVPPSSLKDTKKYLVGLVASGKGTGEVVTRVGLVADKNADGIKFSRLTFQAMGPVTAPEAFKAYMEGLVPALQKAAQVMAATGGAAGDNDMSPF